jgi:hypothetical protein
LAKGSSSSYLSQYSNGSKNYWIWKIRTKEVAGDCKPRKTSEIKSREKEERTG